MTDPRLSAVVLAAGEGARMRSTRPKPLHLLCGRAMVLYVLDALPAPELERAVVVVGHGAERVTKKLTEDSAGLRLEFVEQHQQRGTGDALAVGLTGLPEDDDHDDDERDVIVLPGDTPLLRRETVAALIAEHRHSGAACTILTARLEDPTGYGRIVRVGSDDRIQRIVEHADAAPDELEIDEIKTSIYCFRRSVLAPALRRLSPENAQGEDYLTDVVEVLYDAGYTVTSLVADDPAEIEGVNDRRQLAAAEAELRRRTNLRWLDQGVNMLDPERTYIDATVKLGTDVTLFPGTLLQGFTTVGERSEVGPDTRLIDCVVGSDVVAEKTVARDAEIGDGAHVGPFAVLNPGAHVAAGEHTGPFYTADSGDSGA